jgi:hypothetical protein
MEANGSVESTWKSDSSSKSFVHITGTMEMGSNTRPVDITVQSSSAYKGPDCGNVKPMAMPAPK